jgi:hypothetical protein
LAAVDETEFCRSQPGCFGFSLQGNTTASLSHAARITRRVAELQLRSPATAGVRAMAVVAPGVLRTPDSAFENLPGWDYEPQYYTSHAVQELPVRMAYYVREIQDAARCIAARCIAAPLPKHSCVRAGMLALR